MTKNKDSLKNPAKSFFLIVLFSFCSIICKAQDIQQPSFQEAGCKQATVCFTPGGPCTNEIVNEINKAEKEVLVQAYSFTSAPIAKALVKARKRGLNVQVILDKSQESERHSSLKLLAHAGVPTYIDRKHAIAHNKVIIIDGQTLITGSFNFTKAAQENNAENLLILRDTSLIPSYTQNWEFHKSHSDSI